VAENKSVAFEMVELGPMEPPTFKCDMLMSEAQHIGLLGKTAKAPHFCIVCFLSYMDYGSISSLLFFSISCALVSSVLVAS